MIRMSEAEAAQLFGPSRHGGKQEARPRNRKSIEALPENQVEAQILGFLRIRGWLVERQQSGVVVGIGQLLAALDRGQVITRELLYRSMIRLGEKGRADWVAVRAVNDKSMPPCLCQRIENEIKAPGRKPSSQQVKYLRERNACYLLAGWWDSLDAFVAWYNVRFP